MKRVCFLPGDRRSVRLSNVSASRGGCKPGGCARRVVASKAGTGKAVPVHGGQAPLSRQKRPRCAAIWVVPRAFVPMDGGLLFFGSKEGGIIMAKNYTNVNKNKNMEDSSYSSYADEQNKNKNSTNKNSANKNSTNSTNGTSSASQNCGKNKNSYNKNSSNKNGYDSTDRY